MKRIARLRTHFSRILRLTCRTTRAHRSYENPPNHETYQSFPANSLNTLKKQILKDSLWKIVIDMWVKLDFIDV